MLHVFSINLVKLMARKPKTTDNLGWREYILLPLSHIICCSRFPRSQTHLILTKYILKNVNIYST
jgi:hypothetical protein